MNGFFIQYVVKCNLGKVNFNVVSQSGLYSLQSWRVPSPGGDQLLRVHAERFMIFERFKIYTHP